jgi:hypothetical protein
MPKLYFFVHLAFNVIPLLYNKETIYY